MILLAGAMLVCLLRTTSLAMVVIVILISKLTKMMDQVFKMPFTIRRFFESSKCDLYLTAANAPPNQFISPN